MQKGDQDKTEQPTPYRLQEARKRGEVAKSPDMVGAVVMITFAAIMALSVVDIARVLARSTGRMIELAGDAPRLDRALLAWSAQLYSPLWQAFMPLIIGLIVAGVLGNVLQTGPMFTTHPLKPDFKRMHPMQVVRRVFSFRTVWELGKLTAKAVLLLGLCAFFVSEAGVLIESVTMVAPPEIGQVWLKAFAKTSLYVVGLLSLVALADLLFARREFMKKMRMSRRELKDEIKRRDGDPSVKSKQKQLLRDLLKKTKALGRVREADVILANPTHVAVALRYRPGETVAPVVIAKGAGLLSARIRERAVKHRVPIVRNPPLARALYKECQIDEMIPYARYAPLVPVYRELWASLPGGMPRR
ncbi:EscU/YscU/HrcU family type III secretion system export apparatus switch protein [Lysobacter pythonis]|uniref:Flagellar biosynthetic protein FlhB n=1 Tax=Solilutibacter pythonis TaxID=2483112 RepID=A0A3M2I1N1_9GAMM|nr:EscU/YscU/HrcU family type III secretion system export apparatus switch protein [Lysobacter pythonis]RMH94073.1 EscU/YscU/HrcU family type III secretion system export apparatus switch protein [Lysobacter pythonis]